MSDVERPSDGGGALHSGVPPHKLPARNMADIARLFLDGARPNTPAPRRVPPKATITPSHLPPLPHRAAPQVNHTEHEVKQGTTVLGLAAAPDSSTYWKLLTMAAQGLAAEQVTTVAIVGLVGNGPGTTFIVDIVGVESTDELPAIRSANDAAAPTTSDLQIARALHGLRPAVGLWIIASPAPESRAFPAIASIARQWLLVCPTDNDGLVSAYQLLKQSFTRAEETDTTRINPSVFLLSDDYAHAAIVHKRLRKAAHEFLRTDLALAGAGPIRTPGQEKHGPAAQPPIRVMSIACNAPPDALWAALLDELCPMSEPDEPHVPAEIEAALEHVSERAEGVAKAAGQSVAMAFDHLAQVLDPEERDALTAGLYDVPSPVATPVETRAQSIKIPVKIAENIETRKLKIEKEPVAASETPDPIELAPRRDERALQRDERSLQQEERAVPSPVSLRAHDMESHAPDRAAQWQAVERSIWDLSPRCALLDAKPPMSWATETCISIDAGGRLNVWTLFKDAGGGASWFALREWAREHKNLLALTRRDLTLNAEAEVAVHIVMPLEAGEETDPAPVLMRAQAKDVHLYRMRKVQWDGREGLVVVPIA